MSLISVLIYDVRLRVPVFSYSDARSFCSRIIPLIFITVLLLLSQCANPADIDVPRTITTTYLDSGEDNPKFDTLTAVVDISIRFEAAVDTSKYPIQRFTGSGLRIGIVCMNPDSAADTPYKSICSFSANYLDIPAAALPFRAAIPPYFFMRFTGARIAIAAVLLYEDEDNNGEFDFGERILGICEQSLFAFVEGKARNIPEIPFGEVHEGPNVLVRSTQERYTKFKAVPDYYSTIFIIDVRGADYPYNIPYPWRASTPLIP